MLKALRLAGLAALVLLAALAAAPTAYADGSPACDLCAPAFNGDSGRVQQLLERGADVNALYSATSPLGWALYGDHADIALLLVKHGAHPNALVPRSGAAIAYAAEHGDLALVAALIQAGADMNQNADAAPALFWLTQSSDHSPQNIALIQLLLSAGADPNGMNNMQWTPLDNLSAYAASGPDKQVLPLIKELLIHGAHANDPQAMTEALEFAKLKGDSSLVALLLAYGARVDPKDSAAILGALAGHPELLPGLINAGVLVDAKGAVAAKDFNGTAVQGTDTALNVALRAGDVTLVKQLLALGADANVEGELGRPFSQLVRLNPPDPEMVRAVLEAGADLGIMFYEPTGAVDPPPSDEVMNKELFPGFLPASQALLDRLVRERYIVLSGMTRYFTPDHNIADLEIFAYPGDPHPPSALARPTPASIPLSEYESWLAAAPDYLAADNAQAAFFVASKGLTAPPPIPEAAKQHETAGRALYAEAVTPTGALAAAAEYEAAARLAPWVGAYHRNLCVLYDLGGALSRAFHHCEIYESGAPADLTQIKQRSDAIQDRLKSFGKDVR